MDLIMRMPALRTLITIIALMAPALATAQPFERNVDASLVTDVARAAPGQSFTIGLHQKIREGWHTYWKNPCESGEATTVDWSLPEGVTAGALQWPAPARIPYFDLINYGYEHEVVLLSEIRVPQDWPPGKPLTIKADAHWLVCADICVPEEASLSIDIATGATSSASSPKVLQLIETAASSVPVASPWPIDSYRRDDKLALVVKNDFNLGQIDDAYFFPAEPDALSVVAEQPLSIGRETLQIDLQAGEQPPHELKGVLTLTETVDGTSLTRSLEVTSTPQAGWPLQQAGMAGMGFFAAMGLALLGGLILNLMPCVFPILSLKALSLVQQAGEAPSRARRHGLSYTLGVLAMFMVLAGALLAFRAAGSAGRLGFPAPVPPRGNAARLPPVRDRPQPLWCL